MSSRATRRDHNDLTRLGIAAAQAIRANLPADHFGDERRLKDYADLWGAAARNAVLDELAKIEAERGESR